AGAYKEAIRLTPGDAGARYNLGVTYVRLGDKDSALTQYRALKVSDPALADDLLSLITP
ncbi:MAG: tetratricopeptide repeat protein, partial [Thermodesulfovibrionales bacterium]